MSATIHVGHSPDPDDAFMFFALTFRKFDTSPESYEHHLLDIETLNEKAQRGEYEVSALSIHAYAYLAKSYALLPHGASFGDGYGPLLVAKPGSLGGQNPRAWLSGKRIAVPGVRTSAFLALQLYAKGLSGAGGVDGAEQAGGQEGGGGEGAGPDFETHTVPFDRIIEAVAAGRFDGGLIIHEGQLTYAQGPNGGLEKVLDLGEWWKNRTGLPLPLGGNGIRKDLGTERIRRVSRHLFQSIQWGLAHREEALEYALQYARDMDRRKADTFVGMYVNEYTLDYGERGREAVRRFLQEGQKGGFVTAGCRPEWVKEEATGKSRP